MAAVCISWSRRKRAVAACPNSTISCFHESLYSRTRVPAAWRRRQSSLSWQYSLCRTNPCTPSSFRTRERPYPQPGRAGGALRSVPVLTPVLYHFPYSRTPVPSAWRRWRGTSTSRRRSRPYCSSCTTSRTAWRCTACCSSTWRSSRCWRRSSPCRSSLPSRVGASNQI
jgi:hypothetical protein